MDITFREATADDVRTVAELHAGSWRLTYQGVLRESFVDETILDPERGVWAERLKNHRDPKRHLLIAEIDGRALGFVGVYGDKDPAFGSEIDNLHVAASNHRRGLGRELLRRGALWLAERYPDLGVRLSELTSNERAIRFYDAIGGRREGPRSEDSADGTRVSVYHYYWETPAALIAGCERRA